MAAWDLFREFARIEREMRRMFDDFWDERGRRGALPAPSRVGLPAEREEGLVGTPSVDLVESKGSLIFRAEMPGVRKKNIRLSVDEDRISVSAKGERKKGRKEGRLLLCGKSAHCLAKNPSSSGQREA